MHIKSAITRLMIVASGVLVGALALLGGSYYQVRQPLVLSSAELLEVKSGHYAHYVVNRLAERGVIQHPLLFKLYLKFTPGHASIKSGTYELLPGMTGGELLEMLAEGREKHFTLTLVEGQTFRQWLAQLSQQPYLDTGAQKPDNWQAQVVPPPEGNSLEGWLMPDTYAYTAGTTVNGIIDRAYQAMRQYLGQQWPARAVDLPFDTAYEALILASIVEKETGLAEERARIAGVFVNRLRQNMRLQTDPTVIYGMGEQFDGDIRRRDLRTPTPYNTYVIKGLPPTPIAMPGREAIDAVLHPMETEELYFVSKGDGSHQFSVTLEQHNAAVRKYQLKQ